MTVVPASHSRKQAGKQVAIVGMSCLFPDAPNLAAFWSNLVRGTSSIRDVSSLEWDDNRYFAERSDSFARAYCKRGGFISNLALFDPLKHGVMPASVSGADADQFLALHVAIEAMRDAGCLEHKFNGDRAEVILGRISAPGAGALNLIQTGQTVDQVMDAIVLSRPDFSAEQLLTIRQKLHSTLRPCNADTIPGVMPNIIAGRIANRLGIRGRSMIIDAACASSLICVEIGVNDLLSGSADLVLAGGVHVNSLPYFYQMFCGLGALSPQGQIRPFDAAADGTLLGEGLGVVVLKRLEDAESAGDRIYAKISAVGTSSDGYGSGLLAPSVEGEALALSRAYELANISPHTIGLLEAHGTGTAVGDQTELHAIEKVFAARADTEPSITSAAAAQHPSQWCALGSVKSMIGHCQAAAGIAGLIKAALSLYYKVLPATLNVTQPSKQVEWSRFPCYINTRTRPWIHPSAGSERLHPRRAAVSAFGFGGVNAHAILEEHCQLDETTRPSLQTLWDSELITFEAASTADLDSKLDSLERFIAHQDKVDLKDIAFTLNRTDKERGSKQATERLAIVAASVEDLKIKIGTAREQLRTGASRDNSRGIFFSLNDKTAAGKLAFLLPGLGSAYPNMLADLCIHFPEVREVFDFVDHLALKNGCQPLPSRKIFPLPNLAGTAAGSDVLSLATADSAVVLVLMAEWSLFTLLSNLGLAPDTIMGCSTGEFAALTMNGSVEILEAAGLFYKLSTAVARSIPEDKLKGLRSLKVSTSADRLPPFWSTASGNIYLSADLGPDNCIISGSTEAIDQASNILQAENIDFTRLPIAIPYHTPLVANLLNKEHVELKDLLIAPPKLESWSCSLAARYPSQASAIQQIATELFEKPIKLRETIESMYADGVRTFIEVGPKGNLTDLVSKILGSRPHLALPSNLATVASITQINNLLAAIFCQGRDLHLDYLYSRRDPQLLNLESSEQLDIPVQRKMQLTISYPELHLDTLPPITASSPLQSQQMPPEQSSDHCPGNADSPTEQTHQTDVMSTYLKNMSAFHNNLMAVQEKVLTEYLTVKSAAPTATLSADTNPTQPAFLHGSTIKRTADTVELIRNFSLQEDLYLQDHSIGAAVSVTDKEPVRVNLLPLMVTLELMAEAASLLAPECVITRLEQVRAYKRIRVDLRGISLRVIARWNDSIRTTAAVEVRYSQSSDKGNGNGAGEDEHPLACCDVILSSSYSPPPAATPYSFAQKQLSKFGSQGLYSTGAMFHGPSMQSVKEITQVGKREISGKVATVSPVDWFACKRQGIHSTNMLLNPLLLDNASQLVLFHLFEHSMPVTALLPFHIESIEIYKNLAQLPPTATVQAQLTTITNSTTQANVEILDKNDASADHIWARISGISSRRIILPSPVSSFIANPVSVLLTEELPKVASALSAPEQWVCVSLDGKLLPLDPGYLDWLSDYVLTSREQTYFLKTLQSDRRRREWLMGRIAAKDALRSLLSKTLGINICPADIEIMPADDGSPIPTGAWLIDLPWKPLLSISHKEDIAVAIAGRSDRAPAVGIDIEDLHSLPDGFAKLGLSGAALACLDSLPEAERNETSLRLWCAREAAGKAKGIQLAEQLTTLQIAHWDSLSGRVLVCTNNVLSKDGQPDPTASIAVQTLREREWVIAVTDGQPDRKN